jgi:hypothetical protein
MATQDELFYRPNIKAPVKERDETPDSVVEDRIYSDSGEADVSPVIDAAKILGAESPDPYLAYLSKFSNYNTIAKEIQNRARFLIDKTIEDLDSYVADAPFYTLKLIEELTDLSFRDANGNFLPESDPIYTLNPEIVKCIYRVAGVYDPYREEMDLLDSAKEFDAEALKKKVSKKMKGMNLSALVYGLQLLVIVAKISYVISVHYTIGWTCGFFRGKLTIGFKFKIAKKRIKWSVCIGNKISNLLKAIEKQLLWMKGYVGYRCSGKTTTPADCTTPEWRKLNFKTINCCRMEPIFFGPKLRDVNSPSSYVMSSCFEKYIRSELDPEYAGARTICSLSNSGNPELKPSEYEIAAAREVVRYLDTRNSISGTMGSGSENIPVLSKAIDMSEIGVVMTDTVQSSILANREYATNGDKTSNMNCFGLVDEDSMSAEERIASAVNINSGVWLSKNNGEPIIGNSYFDFLEVIDSTLSEILKAADQSVSCVANLAKWGSSKQLCCFVYMIVSISSIWHSLVSKGIWCPDQEDGDSIRNTIHARWAKELKESESLDQLVALLSVIKQIVDIFIKKMQRQIMMAGFTLPLKEMWELIKITIANGLSEYMDILLGPLDRIISGMQAMPEIRHMINNECFGFDKFLKFMMCMLGNLKWGLINQIMKIFDFSLSDIVLIQDILLTRTRLKSLESLSALLGALINLILGLKDCYTPDELINNLTPDPTKPGIGDKNLINLIVTQEVTNEYDSALKLANLAGSPENLAKFEEYSLPLMADSNSFNEDQQTMLDSLQAGLARQFGEFGPAAMEIVNNALNSPSLDVSRFMNESGEMVSYGEFVIMMEEMTGISVVSIQESLRFIFDILRGNDETA